VIGARARLDAALTRLGLGEHDVSESHDSGQVTEEARPYPASPPSVIEGGRSEAGYLGAVAHPLDLAAIERRCLEFLAAPADWHDVAGLASAKDVPVLITHINAALALHPKVSIPIAGISNRTHRDLCGLCRDPWPCATVEALS